MDVELSTQLVQVEFPVCSTICGNNTSVSNIDGDILGSSSIFGCNKFRVEDNLILTLTERSLPVDAGEDSSMADDEFDMSHGRRLSVSSHSRTGAEMSSGGRAVTQDKRQDAVVTSCVIGMRAESNLDESSTLTTTTTTTTTTASTQLGVVADNAERENSKGVVAAESVVRTAIQPTVVAAANLTAIIGTSPSISSSGTLPAMDSAKDGMYISDNVDKKNGNISQCSDSTAVTLAPTAVMSTTGDSAAGGPIRNLRVRGQRRFLPEKTRHKRQTLQDMTRPLKQWLLDHKNNPYPSKAEKLDLVSRSQMTLTQVSNWFANARRRLKNTVKQPDLTWALRIKLYNSCVEGNAELLSTGSDDSCLESDDDMMDQRQSDTFHDDVTDSRTTSRTTTPDVTVALDNQEACSNVNHSSSSDCTSSNSSSSSSISTNNNVNHSHHNYHQPHPNHHHHHSSSRGFHNHFGMEEGCGTFPKYKHSILQRYLSDAHQQELILDEDTVAKSRDRHHSSSTGSRDFEELSTSSVSSPGHDAHHDHLDDFSEEFETMALRRRPSDVSSAEEGELYWKEIGAALALTSLARGRINT